MFNINRSVGNEVSENVSKQESREWGGTYIYIYNIYKNIYI